MSLSSLAGKLPLVIPTRSTYACLRVPPLLTRGPRQRWDKFCWLLLRAGEGGRSSYREFLRGRRSGSFVADLLRAILYRFIFSLSERLSNHRARRLARSFASR